MSIRLKITGFEDMLKAIEEAGGSINKATENALKQSAQIMQTELKAEMQKSNVPADLIGRMPPFEIETNANRYTARIGYKKGAFDPQNPSDGYFVVFLNYGTPHRSEHGKVKARGFIDRAKGNANKKIKKAQNEVFEKILERLKK